MIHEADRIATMVSAIGTEHFGEAVLEMLDERLEICHCTAFEQQGDEQPRCITAAGLGQHGAQAARELTPLYTREGYVHDPVLRVLRSRAGQAPGLAYFDALHSRDPAFQDDAFLEQFYVEPELAQEAVYSVRKGDTLLWVALYRRRGHGSFAERERRTLQQLSRLLISSVQKQAQVVLPRPAATDTALAPETAAEAGDVAAWAPTRAELLERVRGALLMAPCALTMREADICAHIVMGYGTLAISLNLGISINTVGTHRKRAYAKLGVSSQTELFNVCLRYGLMPRR
jgi:DNA-binding CsgD family transcriptional regulator